jgi:hypothetical protein
MRDRMTSLNSLRSVGQLGTNASGWVFSGVIGLQKRRWLDRQNVDSLWVSDPTVPAHSPQPNWRMQVLNSSCREKLFSGAHNHQWLLKNSLATIAPENRRA